MSVICAVSCLHRSTTTIERAPIFRSTRIARSLALFSHPGSEEWLQYHKSVACIIATNVSPPDAQPLFANGLMRAGLARVVSCFPYRWVLRSSIRSDHSIFQITARFTSRAIRAQRSLLRKLRSRRNFWHGQASGVKGKRAAAATGTNLARRDLSARCGRPSNNENGIRLSQPALNGDSIGSAGTPPTSPRCHARHQQTFPLQTLFPIEVPPLTFGPLPNNTFSP